MTDYRDSKSRADEWAYCATRKMAVVAAGIIVGAITIGCIAIVGATVAAFFGVVL